METTKWSEDLSKIKNHTILNIVIKGDFCNVMKAFYKNEYFYIIDTVVQYHWNSISHYYIENEFCKCDPNRDLDTSTYLVCKKCNMKL